MRTPYLIQRGTITKPLAPESTVLSQAVDMDYMGSAEFEFGALTKSFRAIETVASAWQCHLVPEIMDGDAHLRVCSALTPDEFEIYKGHLHSLRADKIRLKERSDFGVDAKKYSKYVDTDFWWDIQNHVMFSFHKQFMNRLPHYVCASLLKMNTDAKQRTP